MILISVLLLVIVLHLLCRARQGRSAGEVGSCDRCGQQTTADDLVCSGCRSLLQNHCPVCRRVKGVTSRFCPWCGEKQPMEQHHA